MKTKTKFLNGKPDAGNLHVLLDKGEVASEKPRRGSQLYKKIPLVAVAFCMIAVLPIAGCYTYLTSKVKSGVVSSDVNLKYRYCVVESSVYRSADRPYFRENLLERLVCANGCSSQMPALQLMYPGVFSNSTSSIPISVEMIVTDVGEYASEPTCQVKIKGFGSEEVLSEEQFSMLVANRNSPPTPAVDGIQVAHMVGWDQEVNYMVLSEGYAAAIVGALEKMETGGRRILTNGTPASFVKTYGPAQSDVGHVGSENEADNTAAAVGVLMGTMELANSMNQAQQARNSAFLARQAAARNARYANVQSANGSGNSEMAALAAAAAKDSKPAIPRFQKPVFECSIHHISYQAGQRCPKCSAPDFGL